VTRLEQLLDELSRATEAGRIVALADEALLHLKRDDDPMLWANLNGAAAASRVTVARGRYTPDLVERVLSAYQAALTVYTPDESPAIWAQTQRNVGATHLGAVNSGFGDARVHIEAAIAAYTHAVEIPHERHNPGVWLNAQFELGGALAMAAGWRGQPAFIESARAYDAALGVVSRDATPDIWAMLNLRLASCLSESGAREYEEAAIQAAEHALEVIGQETDPREWAEAHLLLGGLYRTRAAGDRGNNLERATRSLDLALSVITADSDPQGWYRAHYSRGPAYLFLRSGDRRDNLRRSLESLHIAIAATPHDQAPDARATFEVCAGQALFESDEIEAAITAFENTLATMPASWRPPSWRLANRYLGQAYLDRRTGDPDENIDLAIARLTVVQQSLPVPDDPNAWTVAYANLGNAYQLTRRGERARNRDKAIECFEAALTVPPDQWGDTSSWSRAQAKLALLYLDENAETFGVRRDGAEPRTLPEPAAAVVDASDPFDLAGQARDQAAALEPGQVPLELDTGWHVPSLLNEEARLLRHHFHQFLGSGAVAARGPEQRSALERRRWTLLRGILEHVAEKRAAAEHTQTLFREVEQGTQTFVLFLRGFAYRAHHYAGVSVVHGGGDQLGEKIEKQRLVEKLAPLPLLWISNPVDSGPMDIVGAGVVAPGSGEQALGFRIESGDTWESDVETLIRTAAFLVFHNPVMTPGLAREIALVERLGRLDDAFFYSAADDQRRLDDEAIAYMRANAKGRAIEPGVLPAPTCRWIEGAGRETLGTDVRGVSRWVSRLATQRSRASIDLELDAYFYLAATLVLLEEMDWLPAVLVPMSDVFRGLGEDELENAGLLADAYAALARK
jgi:tetratricopeptide (TPR) repeat protein